MKKLNPYFLTIFILSMVSFTEAKDWRGIIPLHSTRTDVERVLGRTADGKNRSYYLDDVNVFFVYSEGTCEDGNSRGWNVPAGTVIGYQVVPKKRPKFSELEIDVNKFEKSRDPEVADAHYYISEEGLKIAVHGDTVLQFFYEPSAKDEFLRCRKN
jgi:hypothetical protein